MQEACDISCSVADFANDEDTLLYLEELRTALVDAYVPITQGVMDSNSQQVFQAYMPKLFGFLSSYIEIQRDATVYKNVSSLVADLAVCQGVQVAPFINQPWVRNMLQLLQQSDCNENKETAQWAFGKINEVVAASNAGGR